MHYCAMKWTNLRISTTKRENNGGINDNKENDDAKGGNAVLHDEVDKPRDMDNKKGNNKGHGSKANKPQNPHKCVNKKGKNASNKWKKGS